MFRLFTYLLVTIVCGSVTEIKGSQIKFDYGVNGPDAWFTIPTFEQCGGDSQSPIDIDTHNVVFDENLPPFQFVNYDEERTMIFKRLDFTFEAILPNISETNVPRVSGGGLPGDFVFQNFHIHWGYNNFQGSEHNIDEQKFPLEMHFVHLNPHNAKLAVLGFVFEVSETDNPVLTPFLNKIKSFGENNSTEFEQILTHLIPAQPEKYYRYMGSLTTPPCSEEVIWTVFVNTVSISVTQLDVIRAAETLEPTSVNFRDPQSLNGREVKVSFNALYSQAIACIAYLPLPAFINNLLLAIVLFFIRLCA